MMLGPLSSVESLALTPFDGSIYLNWTAPFPLHLTLHDLNITYCVDVTLNKSNSIVYQECIFETEFRFPVPSDSTCFRYTFTVIPESVVGDGPALTIPYLPPPCESITTIE